VQEIPADVVEISLGAGTVDLERDIAAAVVAADTRVPLRKCGASIGEERKADRRTGGPDRPIIVVRAGRPQRAAMFARP
jgi:hypothetical protein